MQVFKCMECMEDLTENDIICPHCGFDPRKKSQPAYALRWNTILHGRYLVGNVIGQGGFGITYVGFDLALEMKVAIKEYFPAGAAGRSNSLSNQIQWESMADTERRQQDADMSRFLKEARKMAKLDSVPSIVRVRDVFSENQTAYIVMDFVEGITLKKYLLQHGVMSWEACSRLLTPVLDSLANIHDKGFIHRDISPDNIMIQPDGTARLLDMGAAVDVRRNNGQASMAVVKKNFSAPEQYVEGKLGSWTDVYAMAATIYYCLTGKVTPEAMERSFNGTPVEFPKEMHAPGHVIKALNAALEIKVEDRIQDMREFKRRLSEADEETDTDDGTEIPEKEITETGKRADAESETGTPGGADTEAVHKSAAGKLITLTVKETAFYCLWAVFAAVMVTAEIRICFSSIYGYYIQRNLAWACFSCIGAGSTVGLCIGILLSKMDMYGMLYACRFVRNDADLRIDSSVQARKKYFLWFARVLAVIDGFALFGLLYCFYWEPIIIIFSMVVLALCQLPEWMIWRRFRKNAAIESGQKSKTGTLQKVFKIIHIVCIFVTIIFCSWFNGGWLYDWLWGDDVEVCLNITIVTALILFCLFKSFHKSENFKAAKICRIVFLAAVLFLTVLISANIGYYS